MFCPLLSSSSSLLLSASLALSAAPFSLSCIAPEAPTPRSAAGEQEEGENGKEGEGRREREAQSWAACGGD
eukprot:337662-Rhodomonas_salina.1